MNPFIVNCCKHPVQLVKNVINPDTRQPNSYCHWYWQCSTCHLCWKYVSATDGTVQVQTQAQAQAQAQQH